MTIKHKYGMVLYVFLINNCKYLFPLVPGKQCVNLIFLREKSFQSKEDAALCFFFNNLTSVVQRGEGWWLQN